MENNNVIFKKMLCISGKVFIDLSSHMHIYHEVIKIIVDREADMNNHSVRSYR